MKNKIFIALSCLALLVGGCKNNPIPSEQSQLKEFSVTFDANGGEFSDGNTLKTVMVQEGSTVREQRAPRLDYYEFTYWGKNRDGLEFDFSTPITSDLTLFANWYQDPCTLFACTHNYSSFENGFLTVNLQGKDNDNFNLAQYLVMSDGATAEVIDTDTQVAASASSVHVEGYKTEYILRVNDRSRVNHRDYQLKILQHYDVRLTVMVLDNIYGTYTYASGDTCDLTIISGPSFAGYDFKGWSLTPDGENIVNSLLMDDDKTVYACLEAKVYTLNLDPDGGYIYTHPEIYTMEVTYGEYYHLPIPYKQNYTFQGWVFDGTERYLPIDNTTGNSSEPWTFTDAESYDLKPIYSPVLYTITFMVDGSVACSAQFAYGTTVNLLDVFKAESTSDREFLYWQNSDGERVDTYEVYAAATFYAVFRNLSINVHCYDNGEPTVVVVRYGESFQLPTPFYVSQDGYIFTGYAYNGVQITDENGYSLGVWTYSNDADVYVDILKEVFYYHFQYYVNRVLVHEDVLDCRFVDDSAPLWTYETEDAFYGWSTDEFYITEGMYDVAIIGDCYSVMDSGGYVRLYGGTLVDHNMRVHYQDTMGSYVLMAYPSDARATEVVVPDTFNGEQLGIIGPRDGSAYRVFPENVETITIPKNAVEFNSPFRNLPNLTTIRLSGESTNGLRVSNNKVVYTISGNNVYVHGSTQDVTSFEHEGDIYYIESYAFENCSQLASIELYADHLYEYGVGYHAFYGCENIKFIFHGTEAEFNQRFNSTNLPNNYTVEYI